MRGVIVATIILLTSLLSFAVFEIYTSKVIRQGLRKKILLIAIIFILLFPLAGAKNTKVDDMAALMNAHGDFTSKLIIVDKDKFVQDTKTSSKFDSQHILKDTKSSGIFDGELSELDAKTDNEAQSDSEYVNIILEFSKDYDFGEMLSLDPSAKKFENGRFQALKIPKDKIDSLRNSSNVKKVWPDRWNKALLDISIPLIQANELWSNGYNGTGINVCVLDTGVDKTHLALDSRVVAEADFTGSSNANDLHGHGTHVAGIVASTDTTYKGVAPGASILNAKVLNDFGFGLDSWIMSGIDWCISQGSAILTMSLGSLAPPLDGSDPLSQLVDFAVAQGKIVTIAAGNEGPDAVTIYCPACSHKAIAVGSTQTGKLGTIEDLISGFSSRGPTEDERIKPDMVAPGEPVTSLNNFGGFINYSGTSMSTPMVAGLSALLLEARPSLTPEVTKALLMNSAYDYGTFVKDNIYGTGRINSSRAFSEINLTKTGVISNSARAHNIYVPSGSKEIRATLYWPEDYSYHSDVDLYILDPAGNVRGLSLSYNNTDELANVITPDVEGYWKIYVFPFSVPVDQQMYAIASNFMPSEQLYLNIDFLSNVAYHQINVTNSSQLKINIDWNSANQDLDIYLYNTSGILRSYSAGVNNNHENVSAGNPENGLWLLRVIPVDLESSNSSQYAITSTFPISNQIIDATPPEVAMHNPINITYSGSINLSFTSIDDLNLYTNCYSVLNGTSAFLDSVYNGTQYSLILPLPDGAYSIYVNCSDGSNNYGISAPALFKVEGIPPNIIDTTPPTIILFINHKNNTNDTSPIFNFTDTINISANITDENGLLSANITYDIFGAKTKINFTSLDTFTIRNNITTYIYHLINITDKSRTRFNVTAYATDTSNNVRQESILITVVRPPPIPASLAFGDPQSFIQADSYVSLLNPDANFGSEESIPVDLTGPDQRGYWLLNISNVTGNISEANLYCRVQGGGGILESYWSNGTFSESGITWNNQPCGTTESYTELPCNQTVLDYNDGNNVVRHRNLTFNIIEAVRIAHEQASYNKHLILMIRYAFEGGPGGLPHSTTFFSKENTDPEKKCGLYMIVQDTTPPIIMLSVNNTSPKINDLINISANITDDKDLISANLTYNMSGVLTKVNFTIAGKSVEISDIARIDAYGVINFTIYATDTSNNVEQTSMQIDVSDTSSPKILIDNRIPQFNKFFNISATITDDRGLLSANITYNMTGILTKINFTSLDTVIIGDIITAFIHHITNITDEKGSIIKFTVYATDTSNNVGQESILVTVSDPIIPASLAFGDPQSFIIAESEVNKGDPNTNFGTNPDIVVQIASPAGAKRILAF
ncbi:MAG: S8 family serine peptidase [Nanoarchaeota archaeon]